MVDLNDPASIEARLIELREEYNKEYAGTRLALARALAIKLKDFQERVEAEEQASAALRHARTIRQVLG